MEYNIEWKQPSSKEFQNTVEILIDTEIIDENSKIKNENSFLDFGLFSFLFYRLYHQKKFYNKNKDENKQVTFIDFKLVGIDFEKDSKVALFVYKSNNQFFSYHLDNIKKNRPLDILDNGDKNINECILYHVLKYNSLYLKNNNNEISDKIFPKECKGCKYHKDKIISTIFENSQLISILGGWGFLFNLNSKFRDIFENMTEGENNDLFFNLFLSIYFKNKLSVDVAYCDCEIKDPFSSHEIDIVLVKDELAIILEPNVRVDNTVKDFKNKIYNCFTFESYIIELFFII
ncbi:MAG: hypothetical protein LBT10_07185 [Methanobrevibacter sp.]|jgi:hypothetical protein|nr:hypothetical protein [Methanobrevibacter sp.]